MITNIDTVHLEDPQRRPQFTSGVRCEQSRRRAIATGLTALAFVTATAAPASATASPPASHQRVLAHTCVPSSGAKTFLSTDKWSKANTKLCVSVEQNADGTKVIKADLSGDFYYYWGAAWYADCSSACNLNGAFTLRKDRDTTFPYFSEKWSGTSVTVTRTFPVDSGHYRLSFIGFKYGGYWHDKRYTSGDTGDHISIYLDAEVDVP
ncbi:hypothetical protein ACOZ38_28705 [Sphaerisporangium viridialbum]|uniref:hypothetical protein n=1 Tax=Sphaerisporangium viridialbum TaxID=46189 RepID=UPI003C77DB04